MAIIPTEVIIEVPGEKETLSFCGNFVSISTSRPYDPLDKHGRQIPVDDIYLTFTIKVKLSDVEDNLQEFGRTTLIGPSRLPI